MKPSYPYHEMRDLIRMTNCQRDVGVIQYMLRVEGKRYTLAEFQSLHRQLTIAEINLSFKNR